MDKKKSKNYQDSLIESLKDPGEAVEYLKAALDESDMPEVFLLALRNVAEAQGIAHLSRETALNRENLYKMLSKNGNPTLSSLYIILDALGMKLTVESKTEHQKAS
jgi:probable addiction module antidote protein